MPTSLALALTLLSGVFLGTGCGDGSGAPGGGRGGAAGGSASQSAGASATGATAGAATQPTAAVGGSSANAGDGGSQAVAGGGAAGSDALGDVVCPTEPPFDASNAAIVAKCTRPLAVAVGNALRRLSSFDGQTWQFDASFPDGGQDQNENSHRDVAIGNGIVVITGDGGVLASRDAGETYENVIDVRNHDSAITMFQGAFWIVGTQLTASSVDGFIWQKWQGAAQLPGGIAGGWDTTALAASSDRLVAITGRNNARRVFDGTTWVQSPFGDSYSSLEALAFGGGKFAIIGAACCDKDSFAGLRAASRDGTTWTVATNASGISQVWTPSSPARACVNGIRAHGRAWQDGRVEAPRV